jgi:hypothetical protein
MEGKIGQFFLTVLVQLLLSVFWDVFFNLYLNCSFFFINTSTYTTFLVDSHFEFFPPSKYTSESAYSSSFDGYDEDGALELHDDATSDGHKASIKVNGGDGNLKDVKIVPRQMPTWLSNSTPDEFLVRKSYNYISSFLMCCYSHLLGWSFGFYNWM